MKLTHSIKNDLTTINNPIFYYVFSTKPEDEIEINNYECSGDGKCIYEDYVDRPYIINFNNEYDFDFEDLIDNGFIQSSFEFKDNELWLGFTKGKLSLGDTIELDPTFSSNSIEGVRIAPLNSTKFAIAWCDETENDISFSVWYTNGTIIRGETDVDTNVGSCDVRGRAVDIASFNETDIIIGYFDASDSYINYITGNWNTLSEGTYTSIGTVDTTGGTYGDSVSVSTLNRSSYVIAWIDDGASDERTRFAVYSYYGTQIGSDTTPSESDINADGESIVDVDTFNETALVITWEQESVNDARYRTYSVVSGTITALTNEISFDSNNNNHIPAIATFNDTTFVLLWTEWFTDDLQFEIHNSDGTRLSNDDVDIDTNVGTTSASVDVSAINETAFVGIYQDNNAQDTYFTIWSYDEKQILAPTRFETTAEAYIGVISNKTGIDIGFCNQSFVVASSSENWWANNTDGSHWTGSCPLPPIPPTLTDIPDNLTNEDVSWSFILDDYVSDNSDTDAQITWLHINNDTSRVSLSIDNSTNNISITPVANATGFVNITLTAVDTGGLNSDNSSFTLNLTSINDPPYIFLDDNSTNEDISWSINLTNYTSDVDNDTVDELSWIYRTNDTANSYISTIAIDNTTGNLSITPVDNATGIINITINVTEGTRTKSDSFLFTLTAINDPCELDDIPSNTTLEDTIWSYIANVSDVDSSSFTFNYTLNDTGRVTINIDNTTRNITATPIDNATGQVTIEVTTTDSQYNSSDTFELNITAINDAPSKPTNLEPVNNLTLTNATPILNWTNSTDPDNILTYNLDIATDNFTGGNCNQEYANVSTDCGGLSTGLYLATGSWTDERNIYDGDWSTLGYGISDSSSLYINYTKPEGALNSSLWQVKGNNDIAINLSINDTCWDYNETTLILKVDSMIFTPCLDENTIILSPYENKKIKDIKIGDIIYTFNNNRLEEGIVKKVIISDLDNIGNEYYIIHTSDNNLIKATSNHKFYINGDYIQAKDLNNGDKLINTDLKEVEIIDIKIEKAYGKTFDLVVEENNNFFANNVLVHNYEGIGESWYCYDGDWKLMHYDYHIISSQVYEESMNWNVASTNIIYSNYSIPESDDGTGKTLHTVNTTLNETTYYWRVRADDSIVNGSYEYGWFTINLFIPPTLTDIPDNLTNEDISWSFILDDYVTDNSDTDAQITWLHILNDTSRVSLSIDNSTNNISITPVANATGFVNITLTAVDTDGLNSDNSSFTLNITAINDAPSKPTNLEPVNNLTLTNATPILNWTNSTDPDNILTYNLDIATDNFTELCYQEYANVSTDCGGLNTGKYESVGFSNPQLAYDGDWTTYSTGTVGETEYHYMNYTLPNGIVDVKIESKWCGIDNVLNISCYTGSVWNQVRYDTDINCNTPNQTNNSIDSSCLSNTILQLRVETQSITYQNKFYEEAIYWNMTNTSKIVYSNYSIPESDDGTGKTLHTVNTTLNETTYYWRVRADDSIVNGSYEYGWFTIRLPVSTEKNITESINLNTPISKSGGITKKPIETFIFTTITDKLSLIKKYLSETFNLNNIGDRLWSLTNYIIDTINIKDKINKIKNIPKYIIDSINIQDKITRFLNILKYPIQVINIDNITDKLSSIKKYLIDSINIQDKITRLREVLRFLVDYINIQDKITRFINILKYPIQLININDIADKLSSIKKHLSEVLNIEDIISKLSSFKRYLTENLNITNIGDKFRSLTEYIKGIINFQDKLTRFIDIFKNPLQIVNINDKANKLLESFRNLIDNINIKTKAEQILGYLKNLVDSINIQDKITRFLNILKYPLQLININDIADKLSSIKKHLSETFNLNNITQRTASFFRGIIQNINIKDITSRIASFFRNLIDLLNILFDLDFEHIPAVVREAIEQATTGGFGRGEKPSSILNFTNINITTNNVWYKNESQIIWIYVYRDNNILTTANINLTLEPNNSKFYINKLDEFSTGIYEVKITPDIDISDGSYLLMVNASRESYGKVYSIKKSKTIEIKEENIIKKIISKEITKITKYKKTFYMIGRILGAIFILIIIFILISKIKK